MTFPLQQLDLSVEPELHPLYPNPAQIKPLLSANSGLSPLQKTELVVHCISRACLFADLAVLQYLVLDPQAQAYVDLGVRDEDGLGLVSLTIYGFGAESERDVEREECVRFLISQGADVNAADNGEQQHQYHSHPIDTTFITGSWMDSSSSCSSQVPSDADIISDDSWLLPVFCYSSEFDCT
jgi:hypothetical protein